MNRYGSLRGHYSAVIYKYKLHPPTLYLIYKNLDNNIERYLHGNTLQQSNLHQMKTRLLPVLPAAAPGLTPSTHNLAHNATP